MSMLYKASELPANMVSVKYFDYNKKALVAPELAPNLTLRTPTPAKDAETAVWWVNAAALTVLLWFL